MGEHSAKGKKDGGVIGATKLVPDPKRTARDDDERLHGRDHGAHRTPSHGNPLTVHELLHGDDETD